MWYRYVTVSGTFFLFQLWTFNIVLLNFKYCFSNGSLLQVFQSFFVLAESICLDAETSIIKVPADKNRHHLSPLCLSKGDMFLGVIQMLKCKTQKSWESQLNQHLQLCQQINNVHKDQGCVTPGWWSLKYYRQVRVQTDVLYLKTGPNQLGKHSSMEKLLV